MRRQGGSYRKDPKTGKVTRAEAPTQSDPRGDRPRDATGQALNKLEPQPASIAAPPAGRDGDGSAAPSPARAAGAGDSLPAPAAASPKKASRS